MLKIVSHCLHVFVCPEFNSFRATKFNELVLTFKEFGPFVEAQVYNICDVMGQNQSHVAKHETAQIYILSENVKICPFFVSIKNEIFM